MPVMGSRGFQGLGQIKPTALQLSFSLKEENKIIFFKNQIMQKAQRRKLIHISFPERDLSLTL